MFIGALEENLNVPDRERATNSRPINLVHAAFTLDFSPSYPDDSSIETDHTDMRVKEQSGDSLVNDLWYVNLLALHHATSPLPARTL